MGVVRERAREYTQEQRLLEARHENNLANWTAAGGLFCTAFATALTGGFTFGQASGLSAAGWALFRAREATYTHAAFNEKFQNVTGEEKEKMKHLNKVARRWRWGGNAIFALGEAATAGLTVLAPFSAALSLYPATITGPWAYGIRGAFLDRESAEYKKALGDEISQLPSSKFPYLFSQVR